MSLKRARQIANRARKQGLSVHIIQHAPLICKAHNPNRHRMEGVAVVVETVGDGSERYLWD